MAPSAQPSLTPEILVSAYAQGFFPMARSRTGSQIHWLSPDPRAIIPLDAFHPPRRLARSLRRQPFEIRWNTAFAEVVRCCAEVPRPHEKGSWINADIQQGYLALHALGLAHSVECWRDDVLLGGLYGVHLGGAFFGESMFSRESNASKAALVALVAQLRAQGFLLLDTQFINAHLLQFGVVEISRQDYLRRLVRAIDQPRYFAFSQ